MRLLNLFFLDVSAIVTCISKASFTREDSFPGHTEILAHFGGVTDYIMMMANKIMRVSLVTIHIPLKHVPEEITIERVFKCIALTHHSLRTYWGIGNPSIKVCGLNPHAGEHGIMGNEENAISEAINRAKSIGMEVGGPLS